MGQILFIIFFSTNSWVTKWVASLGKGEGRMIKNYRFLVLTFIILWKVCVSLVFYNFYFCKWRARNKCRRQKIDIKGVTSCPVIPALYISILFLNIFYCLFSLLLYKKLAKLPILRMGSSVFFSVYYICLIVSAI